MIKKETRKVSTSFHSSQEEKLTLIEHGQHIVRDERDIVVVDAIPTAKDLPRGHIVSIIRPKISEQRKRFKYPT